MNLNLSNCVVGICGLGQMGSSAAVCFSRAGFPVLLWGRDSSKLREMPKTLGRLNTFVDEQMGSCKTQVGKVEPCPDLKTVDERADVILECVTEDVIQKADLLSQLHSAIKREALLLTTTSGLSITQIGRQSKTQHLLVGAHFWNPAHLMPIVEVIRGEDTPSDRFEMTIELVKQIGKIPVRVEKDVAGFIGNRLQHALWREAIHLVETGVASPEDVDLVASLTFGLRLPAVGPFANMDLVGLELLSQIQSYLLPELSDSKEISPEIKTRLAQGKVGMKSGHGFYDWNKRSPQETIQRRDKQIVQQLRFLKSLEEGSSSKAESEAES